MSNRFRLPPHRLLVVLFLAALVVSSTIPWTQRLPSMRVVGVRTEDVSGIRFLRVELEVIGGSLGTDLRSVLFETTVVPRVPKIAFFFDPAYPVVGDISRILGILDHLTPELRHRGHRVDVEVVDTSSLISILSSSEHPVVVMATTAIPASVFSASTNLLTPWLQSGGIVVWTGELIGGFIGDRGATTVPGGPFGNLAWQGERILFGESLVGSALIFPGEAATPTPVATWLELRYPLAYVGAKSVPLQNRSGLAMGFLHAGAQRASSISWIPVGQGGVILFGYGPIMPVGLSAEDAIAADIAQILLSGILSWDRRSTPSAVGFRAEGGATGFVSLSLNLTAAARLARLYVYSTGPTSLTSFSGDVDVSNATLLSP